MNFDLNHHTNIFIINYVLYFRTIESKTKIVSKKSYILVIIQFSCFAFFLFSKNLIANKYWIIFQIIGFVISSLGVLSMKIGNFNIQPEVKANALFRNNGFYKIIRNPMYTGIILFFIASIISNFSYLRLSILTVLIIVLIEKIKLEEKFLSEKFGEIYLEYKKKTYRLIPFFY